MGNGMNKILPGLFLGNIVDSKDLDQLSRHDITHIVSIHESPQPFIPVSVGGTSGVTSPKHCFKLKAAEWMLVMLTDNQSWKGHDKGITYLRIVLPDTPEANIKKHFEKCINFIHSCRLQGGTCLVHCLAGISRSTTIVLAYLMAVTQLGWLEALEAVKAVRPVANPNLGFRRQLEEFGHSRSVQKIRRRLQPPPRGALLDDREALQSLLPSGRKLTHPSSERAWPAPVPKNTSGGAKHMDSFLIRVKDSFSCLPSCLK